MVLEKIEGVSPLNQASLDDSANDEAVVIELVAAAAATAAADGENEVSGIV